jgi:homoserine kinase
MPPITLRVPASTSNLGSGFDALGLAIDLPLTVKFEIIQNGRQIHAKGEGAALIQQKENNLLLQAFDRACQEIGCEPPSLKIEINNRIPLQRGLGSSAAAIVAGLVGANLLFGEKLSQQQMLNLAGEMEGHPENAAASLFGGMTVNGMDGGEVRSAGLIMPREWVAAAFIPDLEIATHEARRVLPETVPREAAVKNIQRVAMLVTALFQRDPELLQFGVQDWLHQTYRKALIPGFDDFLAAAYEAGAYAAFLSGSGSTFLAICAKHQAQQIAQAMASVARQYGLSGRAEILKFAHRGAHVVKPR